MYWQALQRLSPHLNIPRKFELLLDSHGGATDGKLILLPWLSFVEISFLRNLILLLKAVISLLLKNLSLLFIIFF